MIGLFFLEKADREDGMQRYLPENAWAILTESDQKKADKTKEKIADKGASRSPNGPTKSSAP